MVSFCEMEDPESRALSPERKLLLSILRCAIFDVMTENRLGGGYDGEETARERAKRWFESNEGEEEYGTFLFVCRELNIPHREFRREMYREMRAGRLKRKLGGQGRPKKH